MDAAAYYLESRVLYASPLDLIILLYEKAIEVLREAETATTSRAYQLRSTSLSKAFRIVEELDRSVRDDGQSTLPANLRDLYDFALHRLLAATADRDEIIAIEQVRLLLMSLLGAWKQISKPAGSHSLAAERNPWGAGLNSGVSGFSAQA